MEKSNVKSLRFELPKTKTVTINELQKKTYLPKQMADLLLYLIWSIFHNIKIRENVIIIIFLFFYFF